MVSKFYVNKCSQCKDSVYYQEKHVCVICDDYYCDKCIHQMYSYYGFFDNKYCSACMIVFTY